MNYLEPALRLSIDTSHQANAARIARISAAHEAAVIRAQSIEAAQRVYSKYRLRGDEVLRAIQNLEASLDLPQDDWIKERLAELCSDIENDQIVPELPAHAIEPRGQFDAFTANVRNRS